MFKVAVVLVFCLLGFSLGETAKEAHDKEVACIKACAKQPSILRCERACKNTEEKAVKHVPHRRIKHQKESPKKEFKVERTPVKPATRLVKGRRVILVRKH
jgi:hypothetical protein